MENKMKKTIYQSINEVMKDVTSLGKNQKNSHQGFDYRGVDDVMNMCGPALRKHGVVAAPISAEAIQGQKQLKNSMAKTVDLIVTIRWANSDGDFFDTQVAAEAFDSGDKATAKAMSVALRTSYLQTLCLPTKEPDPDSYSYEIAAPEDKEAFLERMYQIKSLDELKRHWQTAKRLSAVHEYTEYGQKLKNEG